MTEEKKIEQLLGAFYNGDTTPEEEKFLAHFFDSESMSEKWQTDQALFHALYDPSRIPLPKDLSVRLETAIDNHITEKTVKKSHSKTRKLYLAILSAAAVILLCIGLFFIPDIPDIPDRSSKQDFIADTFTNPEEAAIAAEQALRFVSQKLNQGLSPLEKVKESIEIINENVSLN
jgi:hypothetical protein